MKKDLNKAKELLPNLDYDELAVLLEALAEELDRRVVEEDDEGCIKLQKR